MEQLDDNRFITVPLDRPTALRGDRSSGNHVAYMRNMVPILHQLDVKMDDINEDITFLSHFSLSLSPKSSAGQREHEYKVCRSSEQRTAGIPHMRFPPSVSSIPSLFDVRSCWSPPPRWRYSIADPFRCRGGQAFHSGVRERIFGVFKIVVVVVVVVEKCGEVYIGFQR